MGTISIEKMNHLLWLGRYTERVYTTLRMFDKYYDIMIDRDFFAYDDYCRRLTIPNIYSDKDHFTDSYLFEPENPDSLYSNLGRAFDNAVVLREELSSVVLSYIQMSLDIIKTARGSDAPLMELQQVMDYLLAFWGSVDDFVESEESRNLMKCGKYVERLDLYLRFEYPFHSVEKEVRKLENRLKKLDVSCNQENKERFMEIISTEEGLKENRAEAIKRLGNLIEV